MIKKIVLALFVLLVSLNTSADLFIYTDRSVEMLQPLIEDFEFRTGEEVYVLKKSYKEILNRLTIEGEESLADVIYVKDMVYLNELSDKGLFKPMDSFSEKLVAPYLQSPEGFWTAVTMRPRTIVYSSERVRPEELSTYEDLGDPKWSGRLCLRTSDSSYNKALTSSFIGEHGYEGAKNILKAWVENLALDPLPSDRAALNAIVEGYCDVAIVNSYYLARKLKEDPAYPVKIYFANQEGRGVHINGSGVGVAKFAKNIELANKFIEYLLSNSSQTHLSSEELTYPVRKEMAPSTLIQEWGTFKVDLRPWSESGNYVEESLKLFKEVAYF